MTQPKTASLRLMPREMRMMSERIFSLCQMPRGFALSLTDIPMYSQALGLGGFALLQSSHDILTTAEPKALTVYENGPNLVLDFQGQHAWVGLNSLIDLAVELCATKPQARIAVQNIAFAEELALARALATRVGVDLEFETATLVRVSPCKTADPLSQKLNSEGLFLQPDLWWQIYERARSALAPDTAVSRRHAGVQIVNEDGSIIGRSDNDDDADVSFLARGARETA